MAVPDDAGAFVFHLTPEFFEGEFQEMEDGKEGM
jgi:hypothetical protein